MKKDIRYSTWNESYERLATGKGWVMFRRAPNMVPEVICQQKWDKLPTVPYQGVKQACLR
jgi:hypothetical protein